MSDNKKIYTQLPATHQTSAIKNFFEATVEQLYSKSNVEVIQGFIGSERSEDQGIAGTYIPEPDLVKKFYGLSAVTNTLNPDSGKPESLIFYDEFIQSLAVYGVDVKNHNKIFSDQYHAFLPPIDLDKLVNFAEYYWVTTGPSTINVFGTPDNPINILDQIIGKPQFTPPQGKALRNGMIIRFVGDFVIPQSLTITEFIVQGVGEGIFLVPKNNNFTTRYSSTVEDNYDEAGEASEDETDNRHSAGLLTEVIVNSSGIGYTNTKILIADSVRIERDTDTETLFTTYPDQIIQEDQDIGGIQEVIYLNSIIESLPLRDLDAYDEIVALYTQFKPQGLPELITQISSAGEIQSVQIQNPGGNLSGAIKIWEFQDLVSTDIDHDELFSRAGENKLVQEIPVTSAAGIIPGQQITGALNGQVQSVNLALNTITLVTPITLNQATVAADPEIEFAGSGFVAELRIADMHNINQSVEILDTQVRIGRNPSIIWDYYLISRASGFDGDLNQDGIGNVPWAGLSAQTIPDYIIQARGATNQNVWSRVNFWFHRDNFLDAGDPIPASRFRAKRPILEFDHRLELFNHGTRSLGFVNALANGLTVNDVNRASAGFLIDGVPADNSTFIFPQGDVNQIASVYGAELTTDTITVEILSATGTGAQAQVTIAADGSVESVQVVNGGSNYDANTTASLITDTGTGAELAVVVESGEVTEINVTEPGSDYYQFGQLRVFRLPDPDLNPAGAVDGDPEFVPLSVDLDDIVQIISGNFNAGTEWVWNGTAWVKAQEKNSPNQPPLFQLYDNQGVALDDFEKYPNSDFAGNKIFGFATDPAASDQIKSTVPDSALNFPLVFKQFKARSEIVFENFQYTQQVMWSPIGGSDKFQVPGYYHYRLLGDEIYSAYWKTLDQPARQRIVTTYRIDEPTANLNPSDLPIGAVPGVLEDGSVDIRVKLNTEKFTNFSYNPANPGFIRFNNLIWQSGDFVEISVGSDSGLIDLDGPSQYEPPLSWNRNTENAEIDFTSEPEYLQHFLNTMQGEPDFQGDPLSANNWRDISRSFQGGTDIVRTNQDVILGAWLLDNQQHNLVDAIRFSGTEYEKYRNRVMAEVSRLIDITGNLQQRKPGEILEQVLRQVVSYNVGLGVFTNTFVLPYGDNFQSEEFTRALNQQTFTLSIWEDLDKLENALLVYVNNTLLTVGQDYVILSRNPIDIEILLPLTTGDRVTARLYNQDRDSAQCPPTPNTLGIAPLYAPQIILDDSFQTPQTVLLGHDGSRIAIFGDLRDDIMLEFEQRIYNSAKSEFRDTDSLPFYNFSEVRPGAWRNTSYTEVEWNDLLRHSFMSWAGREKVDYTTNDFFDANNPWTWNYALGDLPGHWRGIYEWLYDTTRPHTHPWEMLGFTEKPLWWDQQYEQTLIENGVAETFITYTPSNTQMWSDLQEGIIRQGDRENVTNDRYLTDNPFRRPGLLNLLPVDQQGNRVPPVDLITTGSTTRETITTRTLGTQDDIYSFRTQSWTDREGLGVQWDQNQLYVSSLATLNGNLEGVETNLAGYTTFQGRELREQSLSWNIPRRDLQVVDTSVRTEMKTNSTVAVLVNGLPLQHLSQGESWDNQGEWQVNTARRNIRNQTPLCVRTQYVRYHFVTPEVVNLTDWDKNNHSPIVGWALDGLPIYGPYVFSDVNDDTSDVIRIKSPWVLRTGQRQTGPGGAYTGEFVQDYRLDSTLESQPGYVDRFNHRYAVTPDSNGDKIHHYVLTVDQDHVPVFPYHVGGGTTPQNLWNSRFYTSTSPTGQISEIVLTNLGDNYTQATVTISGDGTGAQATAIIENNQIVAVNITNPGENYTQATVTISGDGVRATGRAIVSSADSRNDQGALAPDTATAAITSTREIVVQVDQDLIQRDWKFGDGAPVENAWKYSSLYSFALTEALLLAKPGRFARVFAAPDRLQLDPTTRSYLIDRTTQLPWNFTDPDQFQVHGDRDQEGEFIANIGYTQFIHSWIKFQGAQTQRDFVEPLRTLNIRLGHRMSGYLDADSITVRTDQYSNDGSASSLIIPRNDVTVNLHTSPFLRREFYTGVYIQSLVDNKYQVRGYDLTAGYFTILESDVRGPSSSVSVGGDPVAFTVWEPNTEYQRGQIVEYQGRYYEAPARISTGDTFERSAWTSLSALPQTNAAVGIRYARTTGNQVRVEYGTIFDTVQEVYDFLISLGRYQISQGFVFGETATDQNGVSNWERSAKDFLFWTTDNWEPGNTLELSPCAREIVFQTAQGFVSPLVRSVRGQFSVQNNLGQLIENTDLDIVREDNTLTITSANGDQIYGVQIFVQRTEHALVFNNQTEFADVIYNPVINQRHTRLRIRGKRTANWSGRLLTEGFIVNDNNLLPNLDNLAESMGRYAEFGFVPVQPGLYEASRKQYGFQEREYLRELDVQDEEQFDFYRGMIQSKGTTTSLSRIGRSSAIRDGEITVFDEWALRIADFGDTDREQSIELKLTRNDIQQEPQLIKLKFPESVTNQIERVDILDRRYRYTQTPTVEFTAPLNGQDPAITEVFLDADGRIERIEVIHPGSGYGSTVAARVIAADLVVDKKTTAFQFAIAQSETAIDQSESILELTLTDNTTGQTESYTWEDLGDGIDYLEIADEINADFDGRIVATMNVTTYIDQGDPVTSYFLILSGQDFTVSNGTTLNIPNGRYQPRQRYQILTASLPSQLVSQISDIQVKVDGQPIPPTADSTTNWTYQAGQVIDINPTTVLPAPNDFENTTVEFNFPAGVTLASNNIAGVDHRDREGRYRFVELYINDIRVVNLQDVTSSSTGNVIQSGTLFELEQDKIVFPDVNLLPDDALETLFSDTVLVEGTDQTTSQSVVYKGFNTNTRIRIVEKGSILFDESFEQDVPGKELNIQVVTQEGIAARLVPVRNYALEEQQADPDVLVIDIDDAERFLKKPTRVSERGLWPTLDNLSHKGVLDPEYIRMPNAGYVNSLDVDFQAYDINALPDLFTSSVISKPETGDLIHVAVSDANSWNVYQLTDTGSEINLLTDTGTGVELYTDQDLTNFLDVQEISNPASSHTYLNRVLTLSNANLSEQVVQWRAQEVVQSEQTTVQDLKAPQGVEARIQKIAPLKVSEIDSAAPALSSWITDATLIPESSETRVVVSDTTLLRVGSQVLIDEFSGNLATVVRIEPDQFFVDVAVAQELTGEDVQVWDHTELTIPGHRFKSGETVQIVSNQLTGRHLAERVSASTITVAAPYQLAGDYTGNVLGEGIEITTWSEHGITSAYAKNAKRVMVQFAEPLWYNQVYPVSKVTGRTVQVHGVWPLDAEVHHYGAQVTKQVNASNNQIELPASQGLGKAILQYQSNSDIIGKHLVTRSDNLITIDSAALPTDANVSVAVQVLAERTRTDGRYATMITLDSNLIELNGYEIRVDNLNNARAIQSSILRAIQMRRAVVAPNSDQLTMRWAMLNNSTDTADAIIRTSDQLSDLVGTALTAEQTLTVSSGDEVVFDQTFNPGNQVVGPNMGIQYQDLAGNQYTWNSETRSYLSDSTDAIVSAPKRPDPEFHVTQSNQIANIPRWQATTQQQIEQTPVGNSPSLAYTSGTIVSYGSQYFQAQTDIRLDLNTRFRLSTVDGGSAITLWAPVENVQTLIQEQSDLIVKLIPGSGSDITDSVGVAQAEYDLNKTVTLNGTSRPLYRLKPNADLVFAVYQAVINDDDDQYYILVDKVTPLTVPHDFYGTINAHSDFGGLPTVDQYWLNHVVPVTQSGVITDPDDPIKTRSSGSVISLPPVEPAAYFGKQLVSEPFAEQSGNGTDALQNFLALPQLQVGARATGEATVITSGKPGYSSFSMWTPGLQPGAYTPTNSGPGQLPGSTGLVAAGFGRGYFQAGDNHLADEYPVLARSYNQLWPRFLYARDETVFPPQSNRDDVFFVNENGETVTLEQAQDLAANGETITQATTSLRTTGLESLDPNQIFVACFWSEPHRYNNQLIGWNFNQVDSAGFPAPEYGDYDGTVVRVKYIRLTELPANAQTQRIIPDTGWAGRDWGNQLVADLILDPADNTQDVWDQFQTTPVSAGSAASELARIVGVPEQIFRGITPEPTEGQQQIVVTQAGPVLTGAVLNTLATGAQGLTPLQSPSKNSKIPVRRQHLIADDYNTFDTQVIPGNTVRLIWDSASDPVAVAIFQSQTPFTDTAVWWRNADLLTTSAQALEYGRNVLESGQLRDQALERLIGLSLQKINTNSEQFATQVTVSSGIDVSDWLAVENASAVAATGIGFVEVTPEQQYLVIQILSGGSDWRAAVDLTQQTSQQQGDTIVWPLQDAQAASAPSRAYQRGAQVAEWASEATWGYFGQTLYKGENADLVDSSQVTLDNIYYPYQALPAHSGRQEPLRQAHTPGVVRLPDQVVQSMERLVFESDFRTMEILGYFQAPVTGDYEFTGTADAGVWMWLSDQDDLSGQEEYVQNGANSDYTRTNATVRAGELTAGARTVQGQTVRLQAGKYYFARIIAGGTQAGHIASIQYKVTGTTVQGYLEFTGRKTSSDQSPGPASKPQGGNSLG